MIPDLNGGGAERVTLNLLNGISRHDVHVGVLTFLNRGIFHQGLMPAVRKYVLGSGQLRYSLVPIVRAVRRLRPTVIFSTLGYVNLAVLALKLAYPLGTRVWVREANLPSISLPSNPFPRLIRWACIALYRHADLIICSSAIMRSEVAEQFGVPVDKIRILANPVDEMMIRRRSLLVDFPKTSNIRFVAAGRLTRQKGFDRLLDMFAALGDDTAELVILGEGPLYGSLKRHAVLLGVSSRVQFEGFANNPWAWFATADAFLISSRWEGMPNVVLEALACGLPVIATPESGGIVEVAEIAKPGAVQVVEAGGPFIDAMRNVTQRNKCSLPPSLLPPEYRLETVIDTFVSWLDKNG